MEHTSLKLIGVHWQFPLKRYASAPLVKIRDGSKQGLGIRMKSMCKKLVSAGLLHQCTKIHDTNAAGDITHYANVMGYEQHSQIHLPLQRGQHIQNLGLNGHVQRRNRLIADNQFWLNNQRPRNAQALYLAPDSSWG